MADVEDYLQSADYRAIEADEARFLDGTKSVYWTAIGHNLIDKIMNEVPTDRGRRVTLETAAAVPGSAAPTMPATRTGATTR